MGHDSARRKEVRGGDSPQRSPVVPAGCEAHGALEHELPGRLFDRPVGKTRGIYIHSYNPKGIYISYNPKGIYIYIFLKNIKFPFFSQNAYI